MLALSLRRARSRSAPPAACRGGSLLPLARAGRSRRRSCAPSRTRTDGPSLNEALAGTGRLLAVFSLLLSAGILLS